MALVSPGVEVSVIDQSQYIPSATNSVPFILLATAQDKTSGTDSTATASGTTAANANKINLITSQRELVSTYGNPTFYNSSSGTPLNGFELNEYGLLAAYSVLGISNRAYVQRIDLDLGALTARLTRPLGSPANASYWLDTSETAWGIFQWSETTQTFTNKIPTVITSTDDLQGGVPKASFGAIGDYAVVATNASNPIYFKGELNGWVLVGSDDWMNTWPTVTGTVANPTLTSSHSIIINGTTVTNGGSTVSTLVTAINDSNITGVTAASVDGKLVIRADSEVSVDGSSNAGDISITNNSGTILTDVGITAGTYFRPHLYIQEHYSVPQVKTGMTTPRPSGTVWLKTTNVNNGINIVVKQFSSTTNEFGSAIAAPVYENDRTAIKNIDTTGGKAIVAGSLYVQFDVSENDTATLKVKKRFSAGSTSVTSETTSPTFSNGNTFTIRASQANSTTLTTAVTATVAGSGAAAFVEGFNNANVANVRATLLSTGAIKIEHELGGVIYLKDTSGSPVASAGFTSSLTTGQVQNGNDSDVVLSNWIPLTYTASATAPTADPTNNTYWYYSDTSAVDIMINDNGTWKGYQNVTSDARGFNLSNTSPDGVIISASEPTLQSDDTALVLGDLWLDTSDLENYPKLYRYEAVSGINQFVLIDNTDQTTEDGIVFADMRFHDSGTDDPATDDLTPTKTLLTSNYVDIDRPDPSLSPSGILAFNTRRSGYNVKQFKTNYFNGIDFPDDSLPTQTDAWVTVSGNRANGSPFMGRKAQRQIVVGQLKSGLDANTEIREEQKIFNLLAAPGYPELLPNLITLNNDRDNTGFILSDGPFRLSDTGADIEAWATNSGNFATDGEDGLVSSDEYAAVFYPSAQTNDLSGNTVVVPATHAMLRTVIRSDDVSFPWLAPAGNIRGTIDNVSKLGYVNAADGEFKNINVRQGIRDTLYTNKVNPITFVPGTGITNFGNKTIAAAPTALDRINVARLVANLRERLEEIGKGFLFEPNDEITRNEVKNAVEGLLNDVTAKRGIFDYLVVCDETNNTPSRIDANELYVDIAIEPIKAVEFIFIPLRIKNTGDIDAGRL